MSRLMAAGGVSPGNLTAPPSTEAGEGVIGEGAIESIAEVRSGCPCSARSFAHTAG